MEVESLQVAKERVLIVRGPKGDPHTHLPAPQGGWSDARIRERLVHHLEQLAVLRIHPARFPGRNPEEGRVEAIDIGQPPALDTRDGRGSGVEASGGHRTDGVDPIAQHPPEIGRGVGATGKPAAHAQDQSLAPRSPLRHPQPDPSPRTTGAVAVRISSQTGSGFASR